jgi:hypothetical protein
VAKERLIQFRVDDDMGAALDAEFERLELTEKERGDWYREAFAEKLGREDLKESTRLNRRAERIKRAQQR